jgi:hypothetical protein
MAQPTFTSFNNNVVVRQTEFRPGKMTDANSIYNLFNRDRFSVYKGMISAWNQAKLISTPLYNMTELQNNVIYVNGAEGEFEFTMPYVLDFPRILEDVTDPLDLKPGLGGVPFEIKLNIDVYKDGDILTYDHRNGTQVVVTQTPVKRDGDGWILEVKVVATDVKNAYFPKSKLAAGVQYMKVGHTTGGEFGKQFSNIQDDTGMIALRHRIGSERGVSHTLTSYANMLELPTGASEGLQKAFAKFDLMGKQAVETFGISTKDGQLVANSGMWAPTVLSLILQELAKIEETQLMWGNGGFIQGAGDKIVMVSPGFYNQLKKGNYYRISKYTRATIESILGNLYSHTQIPPTERRTKIKCGLGALNELYKIFAKELSDIPFLTRTADIGAITGDAMNLAVGYRVVSFLFPTAGWVTLEWEPAFDAWTTRAADTPMIGAYPIHSYTAAILDVTDQNYTNATKKSDKIAYANGANSGANVFMVKPSARKTTTWGFINGTEHFKGEEFMHGMISSSLDPQFSIWAKNQSSIWLKDPTRTVLIELA